MTWYHHDMASMFNRELQRSITGALGRFVAILAITALGCGFYAGLRMTGPDMNVASDAFYDGTHLMDIRVVSTLGLTDSDLQALSAVEGVDAVMGAYEVDAMATIDGEQYATRIHSLSPSAYTSSTDDGVTVFSEDKDYLNRLVLTEGSWPTEEGQCVISSDLVVSQNTHIGDTITLTEGSQTLDETLATNTYTIVGYVSSSYYATSASMGTTTLGGGSIQQYLYVPTSDFSDDLPYTEAFVAVEGASDLLASSDEYTCAVEEVMDRIEQLAPTREKLRVEEIRADAQAELDDAQAEYDKQKAQAEEELASARDELDKTAALLVQSEQELTAGQSEYESGVAQLAQQKVTVQNELDAQQDALQAAQDDLDSASEVLESAASQLDAAWVAAGTTYAEIVALQDSLSELQDQLAVAQEQLSLLDPTSEEYQQAYAYVTALQEQCATIAQIVETAAPLVAQQETYDSQKAEYDKAVEEVEQGQAQLEVARSQAADQLATAEKELEAARKQLESGWSELARGKSEYQDGLAEYEKASAEVQAQLKKGQDELDKAHDQIDAIDDAEWLVMDRTTNYGVASYDADAERIDNIASVFPFIFFLVAALVALTTMTRMVEEERGLIGTFKALGYSRARIASKYLLYALVASGVGSVVGIAVLSQVLPAVIMRAYAIIYFVPQLAWPLPIEGGIVALSAILGVGITLCATAAAALSTVRESSAALMLPRAPKAGKRILLEHIRPLWAHLSFTWKVTFRNLFRYKKRFIMTVIGIAGCTGLLLTGLGLSDSINDIIDKQFDEISHYNVTVTLDDGASDQDLEQVESILNNQGFAETSMRAQHSSMLASGPNKEDVRFELTVPERSSQLPDFIALRTRESHDPVDMDDESLILSEKLATELGVRVGDTVILTEQDAIGNPTSTTYTATVTGITENYIHYYVYMGCDLYERLTGETPDYSTVYAYVTDNEDERLVLSESLRDASKVKTVAYNDLTISSYKSMLNSVNMIVVVLIISAAALAFIVLYNLTNINVEERQREIATLKVLGFRPREVSAYINREIFLLAIIGALAGLLFGVALESFVVLSAEVDQVMFGREIHFASFVIAFALTLFFTFLVTLFMRHKLRDIHMAESLKSVD